MSFLGYTHLHTQMGLTVFEPTKHARLGAVTRVTEVPNGLLVPAQVANKTQTQLDHVLFALKNEGVNMQVLAQALPKVPAQDMVAAISAAPTGVYIRVACFLWEFFNDTELQGLPTIAGPTVDVFDARRYITTKGTRNAKWRVNFNGLGSLRYCVTVERTPAIEALLAADILGSAQRFVANLAPMAAERAMSWAYLHETHSSFAIEKEQPSHTKAEAFVALLRQASQASLLDESYLVALQNVCITNPLDQAAGYRHQQNWLRGPLRGSVGISYVPPPPDWVPGLMDDLLTFANEAPKQIDPLVCAAVVSFSFVFIHPFMDGNGRLSRFLFHHALCRSGKWGNGLLLPVSVAMKRNERAYLAALQSYSKPARKAWDVTWLGDDDFDFVLKSDDAVYRYWDATACVEFGLEMAQQALQKDLKDETDFLAQFDALFKAVDDRFDVRGPDLTTLVLSCLQNKGKVSTNQRKKFADTVPATVFDAIQDEWQRLFGAVE
jgi:Fic family protein